MIFAAESLPQRVISITEFTSTSENKLELLPSNHQSDENSYQHLLMPLIQDYMVDYAKYLKGILDAKESELDSLEEKLISDMTSHESTRKLLSDKIPEISDKLKILIGGLKNKYRAEVDALFNNLFREIEAHAKTWSRRVNAIRDYSGLNDGLQKLTKQFNRRAKKSEERLIGETNTKLNEIFKEFSRETLDFVFLQTTGQDVIQTIKELESKPEFEKEIGDLKSRISRSTSTESALNYCHGGPWWQNVLAHISTLGIGCVVITIVAQIEAKTGVPFMEAIEVGGRSLTTIGVGAITILIRPQKVVDDYKSIQKGMEHKVDIIYKCKTIISTAKDIRERGWWWGMHQTQMISNRECESALAGAEEWIKNRMAESHDLYRAIVDSMGIQGYHIRKLRELIKEVKNSQDRIYYEFIRELISPLT